MPSRPQIKSLRHIAHFIEFRETPHQLRVHGKHSLYKVASVGVALFSSIAAKGDKMDLTWEANTKGPDRSKQGGGASQAPRGSEGGETHTYTLIVLALLLGISARGQTPKGEQKPLTNADVVSASPNQHSLSPETLNVLKAVERRLTIYVFDRPESLPKQHEVFDPYAAATPWVTVQYVDPDKEPTLAKQFEVATYGTIIVATRDRHAHAPSASERSVVESVNRILGPQMTACFLQGHGERDLESSERDGYARWKKVLESDDYEARARILLHPEDCSLVVVAGPRTDYMPLEAENLRQYLQGGGRVLLMLDAGIETPNLTKMLADWGVTARNDLVIDVNPVAQIVHTEPYMPLIVKYGTNPIVQPLNGRDTLFPLSRSFEVGKDNKPGITHESLCDTSADSYEVKDWTPKIKVAQFHPGTDLKGPLSVAVAGTVAGEGKVKTEGRYVALGTSLIAANSFLGFQSNRDFMMNSINWLEEREALRLNPNNDSAHAALGATLAKKGDWDGAIAEYREALRLNPNDDGAHAVLGRALLKKGDVDGAMVEEREALRLNPNNDSAHAALGATLAKKGDVDGAMVEEREALVLNPNNDSAHAALGWALLKKGDADGAMVEERVALRLNPNNDSAHVYLDWALLRKGDVDGAMVEEREALRLNPNNDGVHAVLGAALLKKGDVDGAMVEEREALRLNPNNESAHLFLGAALVAKGDRDGAIAEYREALRLNPNNDGAHAVLGAALAKKGDWDGAIAEAREALPLNPNNGNGPEYPSHVEIHIGNSPPPQGGGSRKEPTQILRENTGSIAVLVAAGQSLPKMGTGFYIKSTGLLLTNFHVIEGAEQVGVKLPPDGATYKAHKVKGYDLTNDLAILEVETGAVKPVTLGNSDEAYVGEPITVISNPGGLEQTVSNGLLSGIRDFNGRKLLQISAPISPGSSGAPVFNERGEVIGVVVAYLPFGQNLNFAIPINYAKPLLNSAGETLISSLPRQKNTLESTMIPPGRIESNPEKAPNLPPSESPNIEMTALIKETQQMSQTKGGMTWVWWLPPEFWRVAAQQTPNAPPGIEFITKAMSPYIIVAVVETKMEGVGNITYTTETSLASEVRLRDTNGALYSPLDQNQINSLTQFILAFMKPVFSKMGGGLGDNMHFLVFPALDQNGRAIADATKDGMISVEVGEKVFRWTLPLGSLLPYKTCPACKRQLNGAYTYCPYDGTKLVAGPASAVVVPTSPGTMHLPLGNVTPPRVPPMTPEQAIPQSPEAAGVGGVVMGQANSFGQRYAWYVASMRSRIIAKWLMVPVSPNIASAPRAYLTFEILRDGTVTNVQITQSSGIPEVDRSALRAILASNPLPPLPPDYAAQSVKVEFYFDFHRQ